MGVSAADNSIDVSWESEDVERWFGECVSLAWKIAERGRLGTIVRLRSTKYCRYSFTLAGLPRRFSVTLMIGASALGSAAQPFWGSRGSGHGTTSCKARNTL